jgi:hypothetical protein
MRAARCWGRLPTGSGSPARCRPGLATVKQRRRGHDPGIVVRDLVVMLADGGECVSANAIVRGSRPEVIIAEIGVDMAIFPTDKQLASWAGMCPGNDQSAGRRRSGKTRHGSKWLDWALQEAAMAAIRTNDVYLAAQYARLRPRRGHKKPSARSNTRS